MKILWLSHLIPYPPKGGVLQRSYYMIREMAKRHEIDLVAFNQTALLKPIFESVDQGVREAHDKLGELCASVEFLAIPATKGKLGKHRLALRSLFDRDPYTINWLKSTVYASTVKSRLQSKQYDLVHFDTISLIPYFHLVSHTATVLDHHNVESHMMTRRAKHDDNPVRSWYYSQEGKRLRTYEAEYCSRFDLNIMCSEVDKERLVGISPSSSVEVVPNGVDTDYFAPGDTLRHDDSIIFVGRLNWYPNADAARFLARRLWPMLKREMPGVSIDIIGSNPPDEVVSASRSDNSFRVHGFVDDIRGYMNKAAVYVCPIRDGGGTKLKILDALAMGKAIVAHPIACEGINVEDGKNVILAESPEEYLHAIKRLIDDVKLRNEMGKSARRLAVEQYGYSIIGENMSDLYERTLAEFTAHRREAG